jgi:protein-disulfide isomerase
MRPSLARSLALCWLVAACGDAPPSEEPRADATAETRITARDAAETSAPQATTSPRRRADLDIAALGFNSGSNDAPVRVIEMSDYGCGYCRRFHEETWPALRAEFVDSGKIQWKLLPFVSGMFKNSTAATRAAECVLEQGDELFEAMNHRIWTDQKEWKGSTDPDRILRGLAGEVGGDLGRYDSCLAEDRRGERVSEATALARQLGVRGTPTFFVVGYPPLQGALPTDAFRQVLEMVYADATGGGSGR